MPESILSGLLKFLLTTRIMTSNVLPSGWNSRRSEPRTQSREGIPARLSPQYRGYIRRDHININVFNILKLLGGYIMTAIEKFIEWARANRYNPDELTTLHTYERHCKISRSIANKIADEYHLEGPEWRESL